MPKIIDYPRASFKKSLEVAKTVDELGGSCDKKTCAEKMGKKVSGGFLALTAAAAKYGFVKMTKGTLYLDQTYKDYKLAYDEQEKNNVLTKAFFSVPLFKKLYDKYKDVKVPVDLLDKVLIREFGVDERVASRVATYFIEAAKQIKILNPDNSLNQRGSGNGEMAETSEKEESITDEHIKHISSSENYVITIRGPKIDQTIEIEEEDDLLLVQPVMDLIKKKLSKKENNDKDNQPSNQADESSDGVLE
ncbi:hypothetical protein KY343_02655 [Candidatus Woesearchaeota archaeon]|nr:hypothetical protein [Candidatus Woesearchaeota archaeon]